MIQNKKKDLFTAAFFLYTALFFSSCTSIEPPDLSSVHDRKAFALAAGIKNTNTHIQTTKGEGWLTVQRGSRSNRFKLVWAAAYPDKLRATLLDSGFPVETILCSGEHITLFSHSDSHPTKKYPVDKAPLEKIIAIPVNVKDIVALLTGRIPVKHFDYAFFRDTADTSKTILLNRQQNDNSQVIRLTPGRTVQHYSLVNRNMDPFYTIAFDRFKTIETSRVAVGLRIKKGSRKVLLDITSFCINPAIKKGIFRLTANE